MECQSSSKGTKESKKFKNVQFWVSDLLKTFDERNDTDRDWIASVGIMGTITDAYGPSADDCHSNRPFKYDLDDGTGVIKVVHFANSRRFDSSRSSLTQLQESSKACSNRGFLSLLNRTVKLFQSPFPIGSCVEAKGKVQYYRGNPELLAFQQLATKIYPTAGISKVTLRRHLCFILCNINFSAPIKRYRALKVMANSFYNIQGQDRYDLCPSRVWSSRGPFGYAR